MSEKIEGNTESQPPPLTEPERNALEKPPTATNSGTAM
jgi:hypothetical protein